MKYHAPHKSAGRSARLAAFAVLILAGGVAAAADLVRLTPEQGKALGVETVALVARQAGEIQGLPAEVTVPNRQLYVVAAPLAGLVEHVAVAANATVKKGELLARLQSPQLAEIQRGLLQAASQLQLAKDNLERDDQLLREGIIAASRQRATKSQHAEAAAAYAERRQALRLAGLSDAAIAKLQSGRGMGGGVEVVAPAAGVVLEQMATPGQRVEAAAPLFKLGQLDPLWLEVQLPVARLNEVAQGAAVKVPASGAAGRVISIGRSVGTNQTVAVRAEIATGADRLRPGQFVEASVAASSAGAKQWSVPNAALVRTEGALLLFVQTAQGFRAQKVTLMSEGAADSLVGGELKGDERIAVRGVAALKAALSGIGGE